MEPIRTRYPIVLVHGIASRDERPTPSWGRIVPFLRACGLSVYTGGTDAWGSIEINAETLRKNVLRILEREGCEKVNLIAHSKGGLDCRYMITALGMAEHVASLTTISTPHRGSLTGDKLRSLPSGFYRCLGWVLHRRARYLGDPNYDFHDAFWQMSASACASFNLRVPDAPGVYYQSFAAAMRFPVSDLTMLFQHLIVRHFEGENDGIVAVESAKWGRFRGVLRGDGPLGVSHVDAVDQHHKRRGAPNIPLFYAAICRELGEMGM